MYGVLNAKQIMELSSHEPALICGCIDFSEQIQPCGIDLTVSQVTSFISAGKITRSNRDRRVSETRPVQFDANGQAQLGAGAYLITYNETVNLPLNLTALVLPRSSLLRSGATIHTAVWDPGYSGKGQSLLTVYNTEGLILEKDARLSQMVFYVLEETSQGYSGIYQGENL
ncbi:MAG: deoxyuridine 5'-triphosphate nucleotidohydrolase [Dehalococcoidales bacterium]|nr:deoxyuridine 5'-triphosphate nucleotidohydrolase [Dehalococcoidales bacterium]MDD4322201.1 deoxyuridine 5'-triphosphate nucleotidohydrolase [Dehalococcoidales bacterium]MDD5498712.1 deoxyuridine 5'-triphosphate nucleotidohydrolase [Dehalococcoidales bacterium]MDX9803382.1 deoxyuridine 5'-triphosphate nucleotidohydrolase [Dehalococcoidales bacterium]